MADKLRHMVRKQLNIEREQDDELKRLARERGTSESELVREAIDALLAADSRRADAGRTLAATHALFEEWDRIGLGQMSKRAYRLGVYDD